MPDVLTIAISATLSAAVAAVVARAMVPRPHNRLEREPGEYVSCGVCEVRFASVDDGVGHLREIHDAPGDRDEVANLLESAKPDVTEEA